MTQWVLVPTELRADQLEILYDDVYDDTGARRHWKTLLDHLAIRSTTATYLLQENELLKARLLEVQNAAIDLAKQLDAARNNTLLEYLKAKLDKR